MFHCAIFEFDTGVILIWQKQELLPKELSCFCLICDNTFLLPSLFQNSQTCGCVLGWIREQILLKATCLSCGHFFTFRSYPFHHPIYCITAWTSTLIQGRKWENGKGGHVASHSHCRKTWPGQQPSPTGTLQAMLVLNCALSHHTKMVRNVGLGASNLLYLLVVPQFICFIKL